MIRVVFTYDPEHHEVDDKDPTGLTAEAFENLHTCLMVIGADDIDIRKID